MIRAIRLHGISVLLKIVVDLNVDSKFIIKIGQKLHAYVQADSTDIQLVFAIAVLYPRFGDAVTSIQPTTSVQAGQWICREEETP